MAPGLPQLERCSARTCMTGPGSRRRQDRALPVYVVIIDGGEVQPGAPLGTDGVDGRGSHRPDASSSSGTSPARSA